MEWTRHTSCGWWVVAAVLAVLAAMPLRGAPYRDAVLGDDPLIYYPMNESAGATTATDSATDPGAQGGSQDGSYNNGVTLGVAGAPILDPASTAAGFDGTDDDLTVSVAGLSDDYTVEYWFKHQRPESTSLPLTYMFSRGGSTTGDHIGINAGYTDRPALVGHEYDVFLYTNDEVFPTDGFNPVEGTWYHLAFVREGADFDLYINGENRLSDSRVSTPTDGLNWAIRSDDNFPFQGDLDEIAFYEEPLSGGTIQAHYRASLPEPAMGTLLLLALAAVLCLFRRPRR